MQRGGMSDESTEHMQHPENLNHGSRLRCHNRYDSFMFNHPGSLWFVPPCMRLKRFRRWSLVPVCSAMLPRTLIWRGVVAGLFKAPISGIRVELTHTLSLLLGD